AIPEAVSKGLSLYLIVAIGFSGGSHLAEGSAGTALTAAALALILGFGLPFVAYALLRGTTRLDVVNAAAVSAHYGSVSVVTFVAATAFLTSQGVPYEGILVVMLAIMETPAIISGLFLAKTFDQTSAAAGGSPGARPIFSATVGREIFLSGGVLLLLGSLLIGWATGAAGQELMKPVIDVPFKAVLAFFLLDMGLLVGRRLDSFRAIGWPLVAFGLFMPLVGAIAGLAGAWAAGFSAGGMALTAVLAGSASYIVVPAAMRMSLPAANPGIYVTLSLGVTFPFNLVIGIPLYHGVASWLAG
ncbi:MAG: sodium-dependent bicarbonate transport family permease, partial [Alphaproteobacteria bacterium]